VVARGTGHGANIPPESPPKAPRQPTQIFSTQLDQAAVQRGCDESTLCDEVAERPSSEQVNPESTVVSPSHVAQSSPSRATQSSPSRATGVRQLFSVAGTYVRARPCASIILLLTTAHLALVWMLPVLPGQDLPQHLAYARILLDYHRPELSFQNYYDLPTAFQPYFVSHYLLAAFGRVVGLDAALRLLLSGYVIATLLAFQSLVAAIHRPRPVDLAWSTLLGSLIVWNPVLCMGFLEFLVAFPFILWGAALTIRCGDPGRTMRQIALLIACTAGAVSTHLVAAGCILLFALLHATFNPSGRRWSTALAAFATSAGAFGLWMRFGQTGVSGFAATANWADAFHDAQGFDFITRALRIQWYDPPTKLNYVLWTILGPFRPAVLAGTSLVFGAAIWAIKRSASGVADSDVDLVAARRTILSFAVVCWLTPWGLSVPSEVTFLNFRMFTVAFALGLAAVSPHWFRAARGRIALVLACAFALGHFAYRAAAFAGEARPVITLLRKARPLGPMLPLVYHDKSAHFGKTFRLTHYLPMYYTSKEGGINAQFWARYTEHLPIGYRQGKAFRTPPDWHPARFEPAHVAAFRYVVMQAATDEDSTENREAATRAEDTLGKLADRVECESGWCLYRVRDNGDSH